MVKFLVLAPRPKFALSMSQLTQEQRYTIGVLKKEKRTQTYIAAQIGKDKSVVCRELSRNSDKRSGEYKADLAHRKCLERHEKKSKKIRFTSAIKSLVEEYIIKDYSPEQIAGFCKKENVDCVSHERIYQYLWRDKKQGGALYKHLRTQGKRYRKRGSSKDKRGQIVGRVGIEKRPIVVDEKNRFGDIEIDLVIGEHHKQALLTINDRLTGMIKIRKVESKEAIGIERVVIDALQNWKPYLHTITSDNGKEFANHAAIATNLDIDYFFARPYHSWERGANENSNGLIRQYFPKKSSFENITDQQIQKVEEKLNNRPRKRFGYETPNYVYSQVIKNNGQKVAFIT
jgi:transposase, IS30 family